MRMKLWMFAMPKRKQPTDFYYEDAPHVWRQALQAFGRQASGQVLLDPVIKFSVHEGQRQIWSDSRIERTRSADLDNLCLHNHPEPKVAKLKGDLVNIRHVARSV